jgi:hypothetical protein
MKVDLVYSSLSIPPLWKRSFAAPIARNVAIYRSVSPPMMKAPSSYAPISTARSHTVDT